MSFENVDIEALEIKVREFTDKVSRIKQKLLLQEKEEGCGIRENEVPNSAI